MESRMLIIAVCAILLLGCASQQQGTQPGPNFSPIPNTTSAAPQTPKQPAVLPAPAPSAAPAPLPPKPQSSPEFERLVKLGLSSNWTVSYASLSISDPALQNSSIIQYYARLGNKTLFRSDIVSGSQALRTYILENSSFMCGHDNGNWSCMSLEGLPEVDSLLPNEDSAFLSSLSTISSAQNGTMEIAGTTSKCFDLRDGEDFVRECLSPQGVPLYLRSLQSDGTLAELIAVAYLPQVSSSDFELPGPVQALPSYYDYTSPDETYDACATCEYMDGQDREDCLLYCNQ